MVLSNTGKIFVILAVQGVVLIGVPPVVFSETCGMEGTPCCSAVASTDGVNCFAPANTKYEFSIKRFGFEKSDGTIEWIGASQTFNAASTSIAADMGNFVTGETLPNGTYIAVRPEVAQSFTVNGGGQSGHQTTDSGSANCSSGGDQTQTLSTDDQNNPLPTCSVSPNADNCLTGDGFLRVRDTSLGTFTISSDSALTIRFAFDVGSGLMFFANGGACTFVSMGPLNVSMSQQ